MDELKASKNQYHKILKDLKDHPEHIKDYDLEKLHEDLLIKQIQHITGCTKIEINSLESIPKKYINQIHIFITSIIRYCIDNKVA